MTWERTGKKRLWNMKVAGIPVVIGALTIVIKGWYKD